MCLIAFAIGTDPTLPLLLAGNRDEFFERPTETLHRWPDGGGIWAGRDGRDRGTWLGMSESGRVALLTNVRSAQAGPGARSRGELPVRWLRGVEDVDAFAAGLDPAAYGGFNLVVGDVRQGQWTWLCNRSPATPHTGVPVALHRQALAPGVYGLSNAALDTPWPKTVRLTAALRTVLRQTTDSHWTDPLRTALADDRMADPHQLPCTGVSTQVERALSSAFVKMADSGYGTRSSLVMRVRNEAGAGQTELIEWTHPPGGWSLADPSRQRFSW